MQLSTQRMQNLLVSKRVQAGLDRADNRLVGVELQGTPGGGNLALNYGRQKSLRLRGQLVLCKG